MSPSPSPSSRVALLAWLILVVAMLSGAAWWWQIGRPVALPDAPTARIACVSYAPFRKPGETPLDPHAFVSPERIDADLKALSERFDCVRTYSQGFGLNAVPAIAQKYGMKVLMGIWLGRDLALNDREVTMGIATAKAYPQVIRGVIVGNEVLLRGEQSPEAIAAYITRVRSALQEVHVPVTYADVWEFWLRYPQMANVVDYITIHILPYWEDEPVPPQDALKHVADVYAQMKARFSGRAVMIGETGWPSQGRPRREASASLVNEARYLREFLLYAGSVDMPYNVIEAFDQPWKREQEGTVGGYWGIFDVNAKPKFSMQGPVVEEPNWIAGWIAGAAGAVLFLLAGIWRRGLANTRSRVALMLAGFATATSIAWQGRRMLFDCRNQLEWLFSGLLCALALLSAIYLARRIAARLAGAAIQLPDRRVRFLWMFGLAFYDLLLVFDGRYRDFPLGLFWPPAVGFMIAALMESAGNCVVPIIEERFMACLLPLLAAVVVAQEIGLNPSTWLWLAVNFATAGAVMIEWRRAVRLQAYQSQATHQ
ncbi:glycoside hydrolase family 17 [Dyella japonica]|uniref:Endo-1,3-beta-glucanase btgC n=1 Tax=Dyella japonica DSM 16301 TaxID=1440762 RepID=A0A0G9H093_9GAMM|nr:glycoside hydrolase family 17 [Dyella japonica]KLD63003.1 glycoside hydrolase family 17 [Dyella japonica DSM 16301]